MDATNNISERLDALSGQINWLVEKQRQRGELYDELAPVLRAAMATATEKLDAVEKRGWFQLGGALVDVATRVLDHYTAEDVRALGDAVVAILDTVRALTQPEVLAIMGEAGAALQHADAAKPIGLLGMVRASRHADVQKGMAVLMELLRHVGRAAETLTPKDGAAGDRKARLAAALGPRRKKAPAMAPPQLVAHAELWPVAPPAPSPVILDGIAFTAEGHLVDPATWSRELAEQIAAVEGITLGPDEWKLVECARTEYEAKKVAANIRRLTQIAGLSTKEIFALFPRAPGRTIARIAGTPKPAGCI